MDLRQQVRDFITTTFYVPDPRALADDASLLEAGLIDSTGLLEVIGFIETQLGVSLNNGEIVPDNLDSIDRIVGFVLRKTGAHAGV